MVQLPVLGCYGSLAVTSLTQSLLLQCGEGADGEMVLNTQSGFEGYNRELSDAYFSRTNKPHPSSRRWIQKETLNDSFSFFLCAENKFQ